MDVYNFLDTHDKSFRMMIHPCYISFAQALEGYAEHIKDTPEGEQKTPGEFLSKDTVLVMMLNSFECYHLAIDVMKVYIEKIKKTPLV